MSRGPEANFWSTIRKNLPEKCFATRIENKHGGGVPDLQRPSRPRNYIYLGEIRGPSFLKRGSMGRMVRVSRTLRLFSRPCGSAAADIMPCGSRLSLATLARRVPGPGLPGMGTRIESPKDTITRFFFVAPSLRG